MRAAASYARRGETEIRSRLNPTLQRLLALAPVGAGIGAVDAASLDVDVVAFEHLAQDGAPKALEEAAALYKGDLLAGISVDESAFEDWLRGERERLRHLAVDVFAKLLDLQREGGLIERAVQTGHRLLSFDSSEEVVHRTLMRLYASLGRLAAVRRQYQTCAKALRRELDIDPSVETTQLFHELVPSAPIRTIPRLAGRYPTEADLHASSDISLTLSRKNRRSTFDTGRRPCRLFRCETKTGLIPKGGP